MSTMRSLLIWTPKRLSFRFSIFALFCYSIMFLRQFGLRFWIKPVFVSYILEFLYFDLFQLTLTLSLNYLAVWILRVLSNGNRAWNGGTVQFSLMRGLLLLFFITFWNGFEDHALSSHHEVIIDWVLLKALRAWNVFNRLLYLRSSYWTVDVIFVQSFLSLIIIWVGDNCYRHLDASYNRWANIICSNATRRCVLLIFCFSWALSLLCLLMYNTASLVLNFSVVLMGYAISTFYFF